MYLSSHMFERCGLERGVSKPFVQHRSFLFIPSLAFLKTLVLFHNGWFRGRPHINIPQDPLRDLFVSSKRVHISPKPKATERTTTHHTTPKDVQTANSRFSTPFSFQAHDASTSFPRLRVGVGEALETHPPAPRETGSTSRPSGPQIGVPRAVRALRERRQRRRRGRGRGDPATARLASRPVRFGSWSQARSQSTEFEPKPVSLRRRGRGRGDPATARLASRPARLIFVRSPARRAKAGTELQKGPRAPAETEP